MVLLSIFLFLKYLVLVLFILFSVAFLTLLERKVLSLIGLRLGPNKVSFQGILQPLGDALKLSNKSSNKLYNFSFYFYYFSCMFMMFSSLFLISCLFLDPVIWSFKFTLILFLFCLGINSLSSIISGWSTFSKYSLIGSIRTVAQLISYEAVIYMCIFFFLSLNLTFNFYSFFFFHESYFFLLIPYCLFLWIPTILAELNRTPYDFSEGESELVSGFNTEFGSGAFTLIFLSEYSNILFFCLLTSFLFFFFKFLIFFNFFLYFFFWVRSLLPRYRFDKLMMLSWKFFIPFLTYLFLIFLIMI